MFWKIEKNYYYKIFVIINWLNCAQKNTILTYLGHKLHLKFLSPLWNWMCLFRLILLVNLASHIVQWKGRRVGDSDPVLGNLVLGGLNAKEP